MRDVLQDLKVAALFLTCLPIRVAGEVTMRDLARAVHAFPVMGAVVGLAGGAAFALAVAVGLPALPAAMLAILVTIAATGALHEDGLADTADGLAAGDDRDRALAIMRDSRIGSYGAVALVLSVLARVAAVADLREPGVVVASLVGAAMASRAIMAVVMLLQPSARATGLAAETGRPEPIRVAVGAGLAALVSLLLLQHLALVAIGASAALALAAAWWLGRRLGGCTGDTLGAVQQVGEAAFLLAVLAASG